MAFGLKAHGGIVNSYPNQAYKPGATPLKGLLGWDELTMIKPWPARKGGKGIISLSPALRAYKDWEIIILLARAGAPPLKARIPSQARGTALRA